jgi:hypothetical protein
MLTGYVEDRDSRLSGTPCLPPSQEVSQLHLLLIILIVKHSKRRIDRQKPGSGGSTGKEMVSTDEPVVPGHLVDEVDAVERVEGEACVHGGDWKAVGADSCVFGKQ